jgi:hypothetical protein
VRQGLICNASAVADSTLALRGTANDKEKEQGWMETHKASLWHTPFLRRTFQEQRLCMPIPQSSSPSMMTGVSPQKEELCGIGMHSHCSWSENGRWMNPMEDNGAVDCSR